MVFKENYLTGEQRSFIALFYLTGISLDTLTCIQRVFILHPSSSKIRFYLLSAAYLTQNVFLLIKLILQFNLPRIQHKNTVVVNSKRFF